jgi:hypothetical protein
MSTLPSDSTPTTDQPEQTVDKAAKRRNKLFRHQIAACKNYRRKLVRDWSLSVDYRRGKPFASQADEDRVAVNLDWSFTKMKQAALFSQVPAVRVNHPPDTTSKEVDPWLHAFEQRINDTLITAGIESAMDEVLPDCINAAGIGVVLVSHEALTEMVEVPAIDLAGLPPEIHQSVMQSGMMPDGTPIPMESVPRVVDHRYLVDRISPADFLWPINFNLSDFDKAPWLGRSGRVTWSVAKRRWNLDEAMKTKYLGVERNPNDTISNDTEKEFENGDGDELVAFDELFYKVSEYGDSPKKFAALHHVIFLNGQEDPVYDGPWEGQMPDEEGQIIGALRYPIRVLSLSYVTDDAIPPSDSAIGRPQVNEINKSRTQMVLQREHSLPIRWFDVNRVDPTIQFNLMKGTWQGMIPVQGNGESIIGEVARAAMPQENIAFYRMAIEDLTIAWQVGQEITGMGVETKGEAEVVQASVQTRIGRERAKVGKFFTGIAEVLGGLICIYEDPNSIGEGFVPTVSGTLAYSILADSTVLLDSNQRLKKLTDFLNISAKSGFVNVEPVLKEIATLCGLDPAQVIRPPQPKPPVEPNISLRLTGTEDMMNPLTLAFLMKSGQAPDPEMIEAAKKLIEAAVTPPPQPVPQLGPDGQLLPPDAAMIPGPSPQPAPEGIGDANPQMTSMPKINQRILEREGGQ